MSPLQLLLSQSWCIKVALGAALVASVLAAIGAIALSGGGDNPSGEQAREPQSATNAPTATRAVELKSKTPSAVLPIATVEPNPPPAPPKQLTAAGEINCQSGDHNGWEDAFDLHSRGYTSFPLSLRLTTDPAACEGIWSTSYEVGYVRGGNDKCKIAYDYIDVAQPEAIQF